MIKVYCDVCKKEVENAFFTVSFLGKEIKTIPYSSMEFTDDRFFSNKSSTVFEKRKNFFEKLDTASTKTLCKDCYNKIIKSYYNSIGENNVK